MFTLLRSRHIKRRYVLEIKDCFRSQTVGGIVYYYLIEDSAESLRTFSWTYSVVLVKRYDVE